MAAHVLRARVASLANGDARSVSGAVNAGGPIFARFSFKTGKILVRSYLAMRQHPTESLYSDFIELKRLTQIALLIRDRNIQ